MNKVMWTRRKSLIAGLLLLILLTALCYSTYWGNVWYLQDDYFGLDAGGTESIWNSSVSGASLLYRHQLRYQPVRIFLFVAATHLVPEEYSFYYNFGLHLLNVVLLFLLMRKFRVNDYIAFIAALLFSVFGQFRMIESPGAMIGGSGICTFFIIVCLLLLIKGIEKHSWPLKCAFLTLSSLSYLGLLLSYEVAFPLFATVVYVFVLFNYVYKSRPIFRSPLEYLILTPYFSFVVLYYVLTRLKPSPYDGARITITWDILTRFFSYSKALFAGFLRFDVPLQPVIAIGALILYYAGSYLTLKRSETGKTPGVTYDSLRYHTVLFFFGIVWYLSSVVLFTLNNWISPTAVMCHHLYLMSAGISIVIAMIIFNMYHMFGIKTGKFCKWLSIYVVFPAILITSVNYNFYYGQHSSQKTTVLLRVKKQIQNYIPDVDEVDAVLIKNFLKPHTLHHYQISHFNGALLQWFDFKKYIESGDDILSAKNGTITFKGPLSYYSHIHHSKTPTVANKRTEIFYFDGSSKELLPYSNRIDLEKGINLHQTKKVWSEKEAETENASLGAILRTTGGSHFLKISFNGTVDPSKIVDSAVIDVNNEWIDHVYFSGDDLYIDVSKFSPDVRYLLLYLDFFGDPSLKKKVKAIGFSPTAEGDPLILTGGPDFDHDLLQFPSRLSEPVSFMDTDNVTFIDWYSPEASHRWAKGKSGKLAIRVGNLNPEIKRYDMILNAFTLGRQKVEIRINHKLVTILSGGQIVNTRISFDADLLKPNAMNIIEFRMPGARKPGSEDPRTLGLALQGLRFSPSGFHKPH